MTTIRLAALTIVAVSLLVAGCTTGTSAGSPSPSLEPTVPPTENATESADPGGDPTGQPDNLPIEPPDLGPIPGNAEQVVPQPGQQNVHPVSVSEIRAEVDGRRVLLNLLWESGVAPCAVLDSVGVKRDGPSITVTLLEGTSDPEMVCIMIAVLKVVVVDLGELPSGTYTITADPGTAAPVSVVVP